MIPAIRYRIDQANQRIAIPPEELVALGELRRREHAERIRDEHDERILEAEARARANEEVDVDLQREYGLPYGQGYQDIWEQILKHVEGAEDITSLRNTCVFFREFLERKYKITRFHKVALTFANKFGGFKFLLNLRLVCKASKIAVDTYLSDVGLPLRMGSSQFDPNINYEDLVRTPLINVQPNGNSTRLFQELIGGLQDLQITPDHFPIKVLSLTEENEDANNGMGAAVLLPTLWTQMQRFLELAGGSIRQFEYVSVIGCLGAYTLLRSWLTSMPNLEVLYVFATDDPITHLNPPVLDQIPFPCCPKLKRYMHPHTANGFSAPFLAQIFHANPGISDFFMVYRSVGMNVADQDISVVLQTLDSLQLEMFTLICVDRIPRLQFLDLRPQWPLKSLCLFSAMEDGQSRGIPSRDLITFVNSFRATLKELDVNWKIRDTGGFLDLPKVSKLCWKLWPKFLTMDFIVALENLQYLRIDLVACEEINGSFDNVKRFVEDCNLPPIFPGLRRIHARREPQGEWLQIWKA